MEPYTSFFQDSDLQFARLMTRLAGGGEDDTLFLVSALLSHFTIHRRNSCLDLSAVADKHLHEVLELPPAGTEEIKNIKIPQLEYLLKTMTSTALVGVPGDYAPMIVDSCHRLFLYRFWDYEQKLAQEIQRRLRAKAKIADTGLESIVKQLFPLPKTNPDWQKKAAITALTSYFLVISGGPGTGKTYTVTSILALLLSQAPEMKISLCAPTGKAAARLQDSIRQAKKRLTFLSSDALARIPETASTIHRLLGGYKDTKKFRHTAKNPVVADAIVVDEASMVSLALMSKLVQAIPERTRLILLGDKNQLSSVEAGAVLGDICGAGESLPRLSESIVELQYSYRFEKAKEIGEASRCINQGLAEKCLAFMDTGKQKNITRLDLPKTNQLRERLIPLVKNRFLPVMQAASHESGFARLEAYKILCSHRTGQYGVNRINDLIEQMLVQQQLIEPNLLYYKGKPIIIKQNDYDANLFNGDTGIIWHDAKGNLKAFFPSAEAGFFSVNLNRLPRHQPAYALTVHESQGSEFNEVLIVLGETPTPLLSRELLYTAVTRAKIRMEIWADEKTILHTIANRIQRQSGLKDKLTALQ